MKKPLSVTLLVLMPLYLSAQKCDTLVMWGDANFCLPKIAGMMEGYNNSNVKEVADLGRSEGNEIFGVYLLSSDYDNISNG